MVTRRGFFAALAGLVGARTASPAGEKTFARLTRFVGVRFVPGKPGSGKLHRLYRQVFARMQGERGTS